MDFKKRKLDYELTNEEVDSFRAINVRMDTIERTIKEADKNAPEAFFTAALNKKEQVAESLRKWWDGLQARLGVNLGSARVDPEAKVLFELIGPDGKVDTTTSIDPITIDFE